MNKFLHFLSQFKSYDLNLIESITKGFSICFENELDSVEIENTYNPNWKMWKLSISKNYKEIAYLLYSTEPITSYTTSEGRSPEQFIFIEMIHTDEKYRRLGYARKLLKELLNIRADQYPEKTIIARGNEYSKHLLQKFGIKNLSDD